jgi:uncharacterized protein
MRISGRLAKGIVWTVAACVLVCMGAGYYFSSMVITPKVHPFDETYRIEVQKGIINEKEFNALRKEEVFITSPGGYKMHALYFPAPGSVKTVIFSHGFLFSLMGSVKYMDIFQRRGFNVLAYDLRYHGKSGGDNFTFGMHEKYDLKEWVDWALRKTGPRGTVGIHGESIGAAIALQYAAIDDRAAFLVVDGPFSELSEVLKLRLKEDFSLPAFPLYHAASLMSRLRGAMFFGDISPLKSISLVKSPVLFVHGGEDRYHPRGMIMRLYEGVPGFKKLYVCPGAAHSQSLTTDRKEYDRQVGDFLRSIDTL